MELDRYINRINGLQELMIGIPLGVKNRCAITKVSANTVLFYKGDPLECIFILCEGKVKIMNIFSQGKIFIVGESDKNTFIGEQAIIAGQKFAAVTVEAITDCTLIRIPRDGFLEWIDKDHNITKYLLKNLAKRLYPISKERGNRSYLPCSYLLEQFLIKTYEVSNESEVYINVTRQHIADKIGISLRSVERGINKLKEQGLVTIRKRKLYVKEEQYKRLQQLMDD